jgi:hypothetical protein
MSSGSPGAIRRFFLNDCERGGDGNHFGVTSWSEFAVDLREERERGLF